MFQGSIVLSWVEDYRMISLKNSRGNSKNLKPLSTNLVVMNQGREELRNLLAMRQSVNEAEELLDRIIADYVMRNPWAKGAMPRLMDAARR